MCFDDVFLLLNFFISNMNHTEKFLEFASPIYFRYDKNTLDLFK